MSPRLLLIGGRPLLLKALERGLCEEGFLVDVATAEGNATEKALAGGYQAIILDVAPAQDLAIVRGWRRLGLAARIIALTPWPLDAAECGLDDVLVKPFLFSGLLDRLGQS